MKSVSQAVFALVFAAGALGAMAWLLMTLWTTWAHIALLTIR